MPSTTSTDLQRVQEILTGRGVAFAVEQSGEQYTPAPRVWLSARRMRIEGARKDLRFDARGTLVGFYEGGAPENLEFSAKRDDKALQRLLDEVFA